MKRRTEYVEPITTGEQVLVEAKETLARWQAAMLAAYDEQGREAAIQMVERQLFELIARAHGITESYDEIFTNPGNDQTIIADTDQHRAS